MKKHHLLKDEIDFADSVSVDDASWLEFMNAGGVYPEEHDIPTMPMGLDEAEFIKAHRKKLNPQDPKNTAYDEMRDVDL
jgi:hypothetical protein